MIKEAIVKIVNKEDLTYEEAYGVMNEIMDGKTTPTQNAAFLAALSTKSAGVETADEISGCAAAMREHALAVPHPGLEVLDIVGTGGDEAHSFNISTTAAFVIASAGVPVAKHGNRAASSKCGTADCLEALGFEIALGPEGCLSVLRETGFCFLFAQKMHAAMKYVGPIRRELGIRTVFNILGPLTNPARPSMMVLGVYSAHLVEPVARVLPSLGVKRGLVVHGQDRLDELSIGAPTTACEVRDGVCSPLVVTPELVGLPRGSKADLAGGTPAENAEIVRSVLSGERGARRNAVLMNAGAGLYVAGKADNCADAVRLAAERIDSGAALRTLEAAVAASRRAAAGGAA